MDIIINIVNSFWFQAIFKLFLGFILAGIIGLERSSWNKPAGFRTHSLVGISAVLVTLCGEFLSTQYDIDPSRISAQLLSGIGFIGAGTILRDGFQVKGLTTASSLLAVTCIGLSVGSGFYVGGIVATIIVYCILSYSYLLLDSLDHFNTLNLDIKSEEYSKEFIEKVTNVLTDYDITINEIKQEPVVEESVQCHLIISSKARESLDVNALITELSKIEKIISVTK